MVATMATPSFTCMLHSNFEKYVIILLQQGPSHTGNTLNLSKCAENKYCQKFCLPCYCICLTTAIIFIVKLVAYTAFHLKNIYGIFSSHFNKANEYDLVPDFQTRY